MDRGLKTALEAALKQGPAQASTSASSAASHSNNLIGSSTMEQATVESVVPSIDYLRTNDSLQNDLSDASRKNSRKPIGLVCLITWGISWRMHLTSLGSKPRRPMQFC